MPGKAPKVLFVVVDDAFFLSHRKELARRMRAEGFEVAVATPPGGRWHEILAAGFRHCPVAVGKTKNPVRALLGVIDLVRLYRRERPDLVVHISMRPILFGSLAALFAGRPPVANLVTGLGYVFGSASSWLRWAVQRAYRPALRSRRQRTLFQNPDDRRLFVGKGICRPQESAIVLGSGVDPRCFAPRREPDGTSRILFAARLLWDKGIGELADAARVLQARGVPHRIIVAGALDRHNPRAVAEPQMRRWSEEGLIDWVGFDDDMPTSLRLCSIACLPSYYREGVPRFLIEAAASGRPIVTTDTPGCREIVLHGDNGLLVPARDPVALADALETLLQDADLRRRMGAAGRQRVLAHFADDVVCRQTMRIFRELIGARWPQPTTRSRAVRTG